MAKIIIRSAVKVWENRVDLTLRNLVQPLPKTESDLNRLLMLKVNQVTGKTSNLPPVTNRKT
jgi:hypothetical protein